MTKLNNIISGIAFSAALTFVAAQAEAGSISPTSFSATLDVGESVTIEKTVTTDEVGASRVDVYFLADNTGSMAGTIAKVKSQASALLSSLSSSIGDVAFGVGRYLGDPFESSYDVNTAYDVIQTITTSSASVTGGINAWFASGGADTPEANFYALHQAATDGGPTDGLPAATDAGVGGGESVGWRSGAKKVVVWFGDAPSHQETVDQAEAIAALNAAGVTVIGVNNFSANSGIDTSGQAAAVTSATDGLLVNNANSLTDAELAAEILGAITTTGATLDLSLITTGDTSGLDISFICTSAEGCTDVAGGESRTFDMTITGLTAGTYDFETVAVGVAGATEKDHIVVGTTKVPEPGTLGLIVVGLAGLAMTRRRRL